MTTISKHKKRKEQRFDGIRPDEKQRKNNEKTPPRYENFDGKPIE